MKRAKARVDTTKATLWKKTSVKRDEYKMQEQTKNQINNHELKEKKRTNERMNLLFL